ncbi:MAG TPA: hypothetical protein PL102_05435, partial [Candidatus Syntrophosphaera sp.]|nr:hypothetical protein [Candidatus Syntrophosphaera sp.]
RTPESAKGFGRFAQMAAGAQGRKSIIIIARFHLVVNVQVNTYIFPLVKLEIQDAHPSCILNPAYNWQD